MPQHRGLTYTVEREANDSSGGYEYEFVLYVEGRRVMTASKLETRGARSPESGGDNWTNQLTVYAIAYIDGLESEVVV